MLKPTRATGFLLTCALAMAVATRVNAEQGVATSATKPPRHPLRIASICTRGFEDAFYEESSIEFDDPGAEESCDRRSLCGFKVASDIPCDDLLPGEGYDPDMVSQFDLDRNGKVECADYLTWKNWLADQFRKGNRKTSGESLFVAECDRAHSK